MKYIFFVKLEQKIQQSLHLIQLDVTNLPQGNYFIRLVGANGLANVKFCKQL